MFLRIIYESLNQDKPNLIELSHQNGLVVHTWTLRRDEYISGTNDPRFVSFQQELLFLYELGVDGIFSDYPDLAVEAREIFMKWKNQQELNTAIGAEELLKFIV